MDKQSVVYDKAYVQEKFKEKYSDDWNFRWNINGTPHRVYGESISYSFNIENENLIIDNNNDFVVINKKAGISVQGGTKSKKNLVDIFAKSKIFHNTNFTLHT